MYRTNSDRVCHTTKISSTVLIGTPEPGFNPPCDAASNFIHVSLLQSTGPKRANGGLRLAELLSGADADFAEISKSSECLEYPRLIMSPTEFENSVDSDLVRIKKKANYYMIFR